MDNGFAMRAQDRADWGNGSAQDTYVGNAGLTVHEPQKDQAQAWTGQNGRAITLISLKNGGWRALRPKAAEAIMET